MPNRQQRVFYLNSTNTAKQNNNDDYQMSTMEKTTKPKQKTEQIYIVYLIENKLIKEKIKNIFKLHTKIIIINQQNEPLKYIR